MSQLATRESQPQPRRPRIVYSQVDLPPEVMATLRMTWYERLGGRPSHVEEFTVYEAEASAYILALALQKAIQQGFDVQVASQYSPEVLGLIPQ